MSITRPLAVVAAAATLVAGLTSAPASAASTYDPQPVKAGAGWLSDQLTDGLVHNEQYDFDDIGLSIDVALGLDAAGKKPTVVKEITKAVAKNVGFYTTLRAPTCTPAPPPRRPCSRSRRARTRTPSAASTWSPSSRAAWPPPRRSPAASRTPTTRPTSSAATSPTSSARRTPPRRSALAGSAKAGAATAFLLQQQCAKGFFRQYFTTDKTRRRPVVPGRAAAPSAAPAPTRPRSPSSRCRTSRARRPRRAVKKAVAWLEGHPAAPTVRSPTPARPQGTANANSTGLAGWALGEAGATKRGGQRPPRRCATSRSPAQPVRRQAGQADRRDRLRRRRATATARTSGIKKKASDQWRRASAQALPVLRWAPRAEGDFTVDRSAHRARRASSDDPADRRRPRASASA